MGDWPDHSGAVPDSVHAILARMHWQTAGSVEAVAPHQYNVRGWAKDDVTEAEFWIVANTVRELGRLEEWHAPPMFYDSGERPTFRNRYLYVRTEAGFHAYWFTWPAKSVPMCNRELVSQQLVTPTRRVVDQDGGDSRAKARVEVQPRQLRFWE